MKPYQCFGCSEGEYDTFDECMRHIEEYHGAEVMEMSSMLYNRLFNKSNLTVKQIIFFPASQLTQTVQKNRIFSGYEPSTKEFYILAEPDVKVKDLQTIPKSAGFTFRGKFNNLWLYTKKR